MSETDYRLGLLESGIVRAAQRQGLKTEQSVLDAVATDPLAAQVGSDLVGRLVNGAPTTLPEVEACEANKACTAGMMHGAITNIPPKPAP
jgi:hypothetical protein